MNHVLRLDFMARRMQRKIRFNLLSQPNSFSLALIKYASFPGSFLFSFRRKSKSFKLPGSFDANYLTSDYDKSIRSTCNNYSGRTKQNEQEKLKRYKRCFYNYDYETEILMFVKNDVIG